MEDIAKRQTARYSSISVEVGPASGSRLIVINPLVRRLNVKPDGEATPINEGGGILLPVTEAVLGSGGFLFHTKRLPAGPLPLLLMQQSYDRRLTIASTRARQANFVWLSECYVPRPVIRDVRRLR